jgi:hypothetical protein
MKIAHQKKFFFLRSRPSNATANVPRQGKVVKDNDWSLVNIASRVWDFIGQLWDGFVCEKKPFFPWPTKSSQWRPIQDVGKDPLPQSFFLRFRFVRNGFCLLFFATIFK